MGKEILVIGGGASGMMAAITAAEHKGKVTIYEKNDRVGKKILATGNGKCNLSNRNLSLNQYYSGDMNALKEYLVKFDTDDTILFFKECGLLLKDKNGYLYPACEQASMVLDVLRARLRQLNVKIITEVKILNIVKNKTHTWRVASNKGTEEFDTVIIACGSYAGLKDKKNFDGYQLSETLGHHPSNIYPALVQVECQENFFKAISGIRADAYLTLIQENEIIAEERGELQITDYGISGIPVFQISRIIAQKAQEKKCLKVKIDYLPEYGNEEWRLFVKNRLLSYQGETVEDFFTGLLHKKLNQLIVKMFSLKSTDLINEQNTKQLEEACMNYKEFIVTPVKTKSFENAQTCAGGVLLSEVDETLQSKFNDNLYFCGEILDVDGKCGGYNLQWAWTSGYIAGKNAVQKESMKEKHD